MLELDWPDFKGQETVYQLDPETGLQTHWKIEPHLIPIIRQRIDNHQSRGLSRRIEHFSYPPEYQKFPPLIRAGLTRRVEGGLESLTVNSAGLAWREIQFTKEGFFTCFEVGFDESGRLKESRQTVSAIDSNKYFDTKLDFTNLPDGRFSYEITLTEIDLDINNILKQLGKGPVKIDSDMFEKNSLTDGSARLGEEIAIFGGVFYLVDQLKDGQISLQASRKYQTTIHQTTFLMPREIPNVPSLLEAVCFSGPNQWQEIIDKVNLTHQP